MNDHVLQVLDIFARNDSHSELLWHVEKGTVHFSANCSDLFYWGTADAEDITPEDLDLLKRTERDLKATGVTWATINYFSDLFCCRKRGMRPQLPFGRISTGVAETNYKEDRLESEIRALFNACGPERDPKTEG